jgi:polar amino acid transport system substrate-binding protein
VKRSRTRILQICGTLVIALVLVLSLAGCGGDDETTTTTAATAGESTTTTAAEASGPADLVPPAYKDAGVIRVGSDMPFPPMEYFLEDGVTPTGVDVEIVEGIAANLGLEVEWVVTAWDGLIPALKSSRIDMIASSMGDFTDRQEQVTFVDYLFVGEAALVKKGNGGEITSEADLAGRDVGASKGTIAVTILEDLNEQLAAEGKDLVNINQFPGDQDGLLAVQSDRVFAHVLDLPAAAYEAATVQDGQALELVLPNLLGGIPYGYAVRKDEMDLAEAVSAALQQMIDDGSYVAILEKYGLEGGAVDDATINGGTTSAG